MTGQAIFRTFLDALGVRGGGASACVRAVRPVRRNIPLFNCPRSRPAMQYLAGATVDLPERSRRPSRCNERPENALRRGRRPGGPGFDRIGMVAIRLNGDGCADQPSSRLPAGGPGTTAAAVSCLAPLRSAGRVLVRRSWAVFRCTRRMRPAGRGDLAPGRRRRSAQVPYGRRTSCASGGRKVRRPVGRTFLRSGRHAPPADTGGRKPIRRTVWRARPRRRAWNADRGPRSGAA